LPKTQPAANRLRPNSDWPCWHHQLMTMHTRYAVRCACGHVGAIHMSENDQPYSKPWERYRLEDVQGDSGYYVDGCATWEQVFEKLKPACPKCSRVLSPSQLISS
jgi:hypothetical protein